MLVFGFIIHVLAGKNNANSGIYKKNISKRTVDRIAAELTVDPRWILYGDEAFINHQQKVREYMYGKLEEALNEKTLTDDQLVFMSAILSMPEEQVEVITKSFKILNRSDWEMNSVDLAYKLAAEKDKVARRSNNKKRGLD